MDAGTSKSWLPVTVACLLAWALPGAGHAYLGRRGRAAVFFALVTAMVVLGLAERGNFSVVRASTPNLSRLQVVGNLSLGVAEPVLRRAVYGELVYDRRSLSPEVGRFQRVHKERALHPGSSYGTAYLWTAGLMNLLLILDAFDLATGRKK
jgi:hypothetical protein